VVNAGSDELSLFAVQPDGLGLAGRAGSGGSKPTSVAVSGTLVYVLNNGTPSISGFRLADGKLTTLPDSTRPLSSADADPAQVLFTTNGRVLIVTERGTDTISSYLIDESGYAQDPVAARFAASCGPPQSSPVLDCALPLAVRSWPFLLGKGRRASKPDIYSVAISIS
jgi:6-phosphogluconolactonase